MPSRLGHANRKDRLGAVGPRASSLFRLLLLVLLGWVAGPGVAPATSQVGGGGFERCELIRNRLVRSIQAGGGDRITYVSGPAVFDCRDGSRIRADSAVEYTSNRFRQLIGSVRIDGPDYGLEAERVHQFQRAGRIDAWDEVVVVDSAQDATIVGDSLRFFRTTPLRENERMTVWGEGTHAVLRLSSGTTSAGIPEEPGDEPGAEDEPPLLEPLDFEIGAEDPDPAPLPEPSRPDSVFADRIHLEGRSAFRAGGSVEVRREGFVSFSDSLEYRREVGEVVLIGDPRIESDEFDLQGESIELVLAEEGIRFVRARRGARLEGEQVLLTAPEIRVFLREGVMDRLVAVGPKLVPAEEGGVEAPGSPSEGREEEGREEEGEGEVAAAEERGPDGGEGEGAEDLRPRARSEEFMLVADSIEVIAPAQVLEQIFAAGGARGEAVGRDSLNTERTPEIARRDWIEGDTVVAHFRPVEGPERVASASPGQPRDGRGEARQSLERLVATGAARSLYRLRQGRNQGREADAGETEGPSDTLPDAGPEEPEEAEDAEESTEEEDAAPEEVEPALHYVTGRRITIVMVQGEVEHMEVEGQTRGLYLVPGRRNPEFGRPLQPDSLTAPENPPGGGGTR